MNTPDPAVLQDARARREALDVTRSMLLQAPAGSGKTTVLTARFLSLLASVDTPEEILAVTFTRKAAAEMRNRVIEALEAAQAGRSITGIDAAVIQAAHQRDQNAGWELRCNPSRLRIETMDALNYWLASQLPISARSASNLQIAPNAEALYRRAARRCLTDAATDPACAAAADLLFERLDNDWQRVERLLAAMLKERSHWLSRMMSASEEGLIGRIERGLESVLRAEIAAAMSTLSSELLSDSERLLQNSSNVRGPNQRLTGEPACVGNWRALAELALTGDEWRKLCPIKGADKETKARFQRWLEALMARPGTKAAMISLRRLPDHCISAADRDALGALARLLQQAAAELELTFAASNQVDFTYVAVAARRALTEQNEPSDLALRTGMSLRHILVDEFQDTSFDQFDLLTALTAGWEPHDGRSLFVVGDPMQSIYQFREAEVGLFVRTRDHGLGAIRLEPLQLRRNFRSSSAVIEWVNEHFAQLFPDADDQRLAAIRYLSSTAGKPQTSDDPPAVELHAFEDADYGAEAREVVKIVRSARASNPKGSIAVLVAARPHASALVAQLMAANIAVRGVDLEPLNDRAVVRDLAALTRALLHGADRSAWHALLRSPFCGLTLAELETAFAAEDGDLFARLQRATVASRLCEALEPAILGAERAQPLWRRVEACWLRLGGPVVHRQEVDRLNAQRFIDALATHDDPESLAGDALTEVTKALYSSSPPQQGAVEVMTIHSAKGLEWDVVILPGLGRATAPTRDPLLHWIELPRPSRDTDLLLAPIKATDQESQTSLASYIKGLRRKRLAVERVRLLYVAATRARRALHLMGGLKPETPNSPPKPKSGTLLDILCGTLEAPFIEKYRQTLEAKAVSQVATTTSTMSLQRLPVHWRVPEPPPAPLAQRISLGSPTPEALPEYSWVGLTSRAVGTIVHAELRRLAESESDADHADYGAWLSELGVGATELTSASARIREALERTLSDTRGRWLLRGRHREAHSEWRLTGTYQGRVVSVIFDRMLVDEDGQRWVIDYKTGTHEGGAVQQFIDREAERYRPQMTRYAALAARIDGAPVKVALYFPLLGVFRELPLSQNEPASENVRRP